MRTKPLILATTKIKSKVKNKVKHAKHKSKVSRKAIIKIIRTKHQKRVWLSLILYCMQSSLLPLFYCHTLTELSFLMTTSYLVLWLTVLKISITKGLFFLSDFLLYHTPSSGIIDHYCIMGNLKKSGKTKNKLKTIYPKNHESFKSSKPRVQF